MPTPVTTTFRGNGGAVESMRDTEARVSVEAALATRTASLTLSRDAMSSPGVLR